MVAKYNVSYGNSRRKKMAVKLFLKKRKKESIEFIPLCPVKAF